LWQFLKAERKPKDIGQSKAVQNVKSAQLKRVFNIDVEICDKCGGDVRIIASIAQARLLLAKIRQSF